MKRTLSVLAYLVLALWLAGCSGEATPVPATATPSPVATPSSTPILTPSLTPRPTATRTLTVTPLPPAPTRLPTTAAQSAIWAKWQTSRHGNTYDLGKGPNTYCSRCHAPQNWDPASKVDAPPNCVSCKFATDATVRIARSNPLVSQSDWRNIGCDICHPMQGAVASSEIAWFDKAAGKYEPVATVNALCEHCHTDTDVLNHRIDLGKTAHTGFQCTQCHDAHTTQAGCTSSQCHSNISKVSGHDAAHAKVSCAACHDASGLKVGPDNSTKTWTTWQTTQVAGNNMITALVSHNLQKQADCTRCHFKDNPWDLAFPVSNTP